MKKRLIIGLVVATIGTSLFIAGCAKKKDIKPQADNTESVENNDSKKDNETDKEDTGIISNEDMYSLFGTNIDAIKAIFDKHKIDYEELNKDSNYEGISLVQHNCIDSYDVYPLAYYEINSKGEDSETTFIAYTIEMNIDKEQIKDGKFDFSSTLLADIDKLVFPDRDIADKVNEAVKNRYVDNIDDNDSKILDLSDGVSVDGGGRTLANIFLDNDSITLCIMVHSY